MFSPVPGSTLLYPSGPPNDLHRLHLFVLMTPPGGPAQQVLMVPVTSKHEKSDGTCAITAGAHEFVTHDSVIEYRHARIEPVQKLLDGVKSGLFVEKSPVTAELFAKIHAGFFHSKYTKPFARDFLKLYQLAVPTPTLGKPPSGTPPSA